MIKTEGIVLSEIRFKETSKILNVYTEKLGKISIMAQGAYRPKSQLIAITQPFSLVEFQLTKGKNLYYISQADLIQSYYSIRENMNRLTYGFYLLELIEKSIPEEEENQKLFSLLKKGLEYLSKENDKYLEFVVAYELKYISFLGYRPFINTCVVCEGDLTGKIKFSNLLGGVICSNCFSEDFTAKNIDIAIVKALNSLLYSTFEGLFELKISRDILIKLHEILVDYILFNIDRKEFKSLSLINTMLD